MSSKMDPVDGGKGASPTKTKVEGGYRRRYRKPRRENKKPAVIGPEIVTFGGLTEDLKGPIYDVGTGSQADQFTATTKTLAIYSGRKCADPQEIRITIESQKDVLIPIPNTRTYINKEVAKLLLGK